MPQSFGSLAFTAAVKALQERYGSRRQYERLEQRGNQRGGLTDQEVEFITARDSCYIATVGATGWPYIQHRGGPPGFMKVLDEHTIAFADYRGNKQHQRGEPRHRLARGDNHGRLPNRARLKLLGSARIIERNEADEVFQRALSPGYEATVERVFVIRLEAFDWNCSQHITPRYTEEQIHDALQPTLARMDELQRENSELRRLARRA